jgi:hypothetical protein
MLIGSGDSQTSREREDLISLHLCSQNKESRLQMYKGISKEAFYYTATKRRNTEESCLLGYKAV